MYSELFFRILNFALLLALAAYLFYRYLLPVLRSRITAQRALLRTLEHSKKEVVREQKDTIQSTDDQAILCRQLQEKLQVWISAFKEQQKEHSSFSKEQQNKIAIKRKLQEEKYALIQLERKAVPHITYTVQELLQTFFKDKKHEQDFTTRVIEHMQSSIHK